MKLTAEATVLNDGKLNTNINNAQDTADTAVTKANNAQSTADSAQATANQAKTIADNTNQYFWFTSSGTDTGAHISEKTQAQFIASPSGGNLLARSNGIAVRDGLTELATFSASGVDIKQNNTSMATFSASNARIGKATSANEGNVFIDSDSVDIRKGSTVLSTFTANGAELGKNSNTAIIKMCGDAVVLEGFSDPQDISFVGYELSTKTGGSYLFVQEGVDYKNTNLIAKQGTTEAGLQISYNDMNDISADLVCGSNSVVVATDGIGVNGQLNVDYDYIKNLYGYNNTVSSKPNMYIGTTGLIHRTTYVVDNTSSKRFKHDIKDVTNPTLDPHLLYDIEVKQFRFNDDTEASRKGIDLIGFIAEQVEEVYPIAVDYDENGQVETWREHYIIPPMLKLIQEQHEQIEELTKRIEALERANK